MSPEIVKVILIVMLGIVALTLFSAFRTMMKGPSTNQKFMKTLGLRVAIAFGTIGFIVLCGAMGWIETN